MQIWLSDVPYKRDVVSTGGTPSLPLFPADWTTSQTNYYPYSSKSRSFMQEEGTEIAAHIIPLICYF